MMLPLLGLVLVLGVQFGCVFGSDNKGREFYVAYFYHDRGSSAGRNDLILSSNRQANVRVECKDPYVNRTLTIPANGLVRHLLPGNVRVSRAGRESRGVRITSDVDITVHGSNAVDGTTGAFLALPARDDALEFLLASYTPLSTRYAQFVVVGSQDSTSVQVFKPRPGGGYDVVSIFIIGEMDTYTFLTYADDYTGWLVRANRPVSVFSGHECANVPQTVGYCDQLVVGVPPVISHGNLFVTIPVPGRSVNTGYLIRPVALFAGTEVTISRESEITRYTLKAGEYGTTEIKPTNQYAKVNCSQPCLLIQYNKGGTADGSGQDPFMTIITPTNQHTNDVTFGTPRRFANQPFTNYLTVVTSNTSVEDLFLNNQSQAFRNWQPVSGWGNFVIATFNIPDGFYNLAAVSGSSQGRFSAIVQGHSVANEESYAYQAGFGVNQAEWTTTPSTTRIPTSIPVPTLPPGSLVPALDIVVNGTFYTRDGSTLSPQCTSGYSTSLQSRNLQMSNKIEDRLGNGLCPTVYRGTELYTTGFSFISAGNMGLARAGVLLPAKLTLTFDQMQNCGREISRYLQDHANWGTPLIPQLPGCPYIDFVPAMFTHYDWTWKCLN